MNKTRVFRAAVLLFIGGACFLAAAPITLEEAVQSAVANNNTLKNSRLALDSAARTKKFSWNQLLPRLSGTSVGFSNTHTLRTPAPVKPDPENAMGAVSVGATITFSADIPTQFKLNDAAYSQALAAYNNQLATLEANVATRFYTLLAQNMNIALLEENLEITKTSYESSKASYDKGLTDELSMLTAELAYREAGPALDTARETYRQAMAEFCNIIGMDASVSIEPSGEISTQLLKLPSARDLVNQYLPQHYSVQTAEIAVRQAELSARSRIMQLVPSLSVGETITVRPDEMSFADNTTQGAFSVTLSIPLNPWVPGSADYVNRKNDKNTVATRKNSASDARLTVERSIWTAVNTLEQRAATIDSSALDQRIADRRYELSEQGYRSGLVSQEDLNEANRTRLQKEQAVVQAKVDYLSAVYTLAAALSLSVDKLYELYGE
jgi:multidrug efflux system outer membrane protein